MNVPSISSTLQIGDKLHVTVFGEDAISGSYDVDNQGAVTLPLVGSLKAAGLTRSEFGVSIADELRRRFIRNPKVTVEDIQVRPFYILGEVEKPGEYSFRNGLDIWRAMALAGGQTYRASSSTVAIQRAGDSQWRDYDLASAPDIQPGDVIRVPQRWF